jgi:hypothetical protein
MNFRMRAAPITETAIGHTSHSSLGRQRQPTATAGIKATIEAHALGCHWFFIAPTAVSSAASCMVGRVATPLLHMTKRQM